MLAFGFQYQLVSHSSCWDSTFTGKCPEVSFRNGAAFCGKHPHFQVQSSRHANGPALEKGCCHVSAAYFELANSIVKNSEVLRREANATQAADALESRAPYRRAAEAIAPLRSGQCL
jgi:hypothetical protein